MPLLLDDIALFVEVARRRSISHSAEYLGLPPSTVSRRLSQLEAALGFKLLNRSTRRMALTELGARYYERCLPLIEEARVVHEQLNEARLKPQGHLRVSMPGSFAALMLPTLLRGFTTQYPDIVCEVDLGMQPVDPVSNPFDVALRFGPQRDSTLVSRQVMLLDHWLFAAPAYLERHGRPADPEGLLAHQCLRPFLGAEMARWALRRGDETRHVAVEGRIAVNNIGMLATLARDGLGIAPIPHRPILHGVGALDGLERVLPEWQLDPIPLYALLPSRTLPAKTRVFLDFLSSLLGDEARGQPPAE